MKNIKTKVGNSYFPAHFLWTTKLILTAFFVFNLFMAFIVLFLLPKNVRKTFFFQLDLFPTLLLNLFFLRRRGCTVWLLAKFNFSEFDLYNNVYYIITQYICFMNLLMLGMMFFFFLLYEKFIRNCTISNKFFLFLFFD